MRVSLFPFFLFTIILSNSAYGQQIDDQSLQKLQNQQQTRVMDGMITVVMDDTTSPAFFTSQFAALGYEVSYADTTRFSVPLLIPDYTNDHPLLKSDAVFAFDHLKDFQEKQIEVLEKILSERSLEGGEFTSMKERLGYMKSGKLILVQFNYGMTKEKFTDFINAFPNVKKETHDLPPTIQRSANLIVETGKEIEAVEEVSKLPFVQTAALIGIINE